MLYYLHVDKLKTHASVWGYIVTHSHTCTHSNLTAKPHIAGSEQNQLLAEMIYKQWSQDYKLDKVVLFNYSVYLSYPNTSNPNTLELKNSSGDTLYESHIMEEPPLIPAENDSTVAPPFNAYSGNGSVSVS